MTFIIPFSYHLADTIAFLILCSVGLAIVFGMMGVINIAHGEFILLGAYVTTIAGRLGVPLPVAMLLAILVTGLVGVLLERLVIRHLYGRLFDSIVATWAISLIAMQGMLILAGPSMISVGTPLGDFSAAGYTFSCAGSSIPICCPAYPQVSTRLQTIQFEFSNPVTNRVINRNGNFGI